MEIKSIPMHDHKMILSTLWIFVTLNYLYCDVIAVMDPIILNQLLTGKVGSLHMDRNFLLGAALLMEIPISMVILSRVLSYKANRLANMIAATIKTIVMIITMFVGTPASYYIFFGTIEIATTTLIIYYAWKWRESTNNYSTHSSEAHIPKY